MDDLTILSPCQEHTIAGLRRLEELVSWAGLQFKARKCRSLSLRRGKVAPVRFEVDGQTIPTVREQPVKSLGRWYGFPVTDRGRGTEIQRQVEDGLKRIDATCLPGRYKLWCSQFGLLPRVLWLITVYEVALSRVERMQQRISVFWRKWLGIPRMLTSVALFQRTGALQLPF